MLFFVCLVMGAVSALQEVWRSAGLRDGGDSSGGSGVTRQLASALAEQGAGDSRCYRHCY